MREHHDWKGRVVRGRVQWYVYLCRNPNRACDQPERECEYRPDEEIIHMCEARVSFCSETYGFGNPVHLAIGRFGLCVDGVVDCKQDCFELKGWFVGIFKDGIGNELTLR